MNFIASIQESRAPKVPPVTLGVWDRHCEGDAQGLSWTGAAQQLRPLSCSSTLAALTCVSLLGVDSPGRAS